MMSRGAVFFLYSFVLHNICVVLPASTSSPTACSSYRTKQDRAHTNTNKYGESECGVCFCIPLYCTAFVLYGLPQPAHQLLAPSVIVVFHGNSMTGSKTKQNRAETLSGNSPTSLSSCSSSSKSGRCSGRLRASRSPR